MKVSQIGEKGYEGFLMFSGGIERDQRHWWVK